VRKLKIYVDKYGPEVGPKLYRVLQSQAAHAGVGARLRRKIEAIRERGSRPLPLFDNVPRQDETDFRAESLSPDAALPSPQAER
jgi:hypothetical protein